jgi:hypothetical protein
MAGSLSDLPNYVADAYALGPVQRFVPENIVLGSYTFLPWVRSGVAAAVTAPTDGTLRASVHVSVPVQADGVPDLEVDQPLEVRGPGDVLGLDERQIIRRYPAPGTTNAEDSFLAHIEFNRPELPWLFSPAAPNGDRLIAWLALVVLAEGRYTLRPGQGGLVDVVTTFKSELQPLDPATAWGSAWAHAQLIGPADSGPSVSDRLTTAYGSVNLSRLVCPRHLDASTGYVACVVPAYDAGAQAGRGTGDPGKLEPAWLRASDGSDADETVDLPVYTSWRFATGAAGDFASLAGRLNGLPCPWQVGRRITDTASPGGGLPDLVAGDPGRLQTIHAPLFSPQSPSAASHDPAEVAAAIAETAGWPPGETQALRAQLNRPDALARTPPPGGLPPADIPVVGPEIYARYHAAQSRVDPSRDGDWFGQLNLHPEHRVVAGLGVRVVQKDVEQLMQSAWAQVGAIDDANRQVRRAQLALAVSTVWHERNVQALSFGDLLAATRAVQSRVLAQPALTVAAAVGDSSLAASATTAAFRRMTRPFGGLARLAVGRRAELARLIADGAAPRDHRRPYRDLDGVSGVSQAAANSLDPATLAPVLGVTPDQVVATLLQHGAVLAANPALPDILTPAALQTATVASGFDLSQIAAQRALTALMRAAPRNPQAEPWRALAVGGPLGGLANVPGVGQKAGELGKQLGIGLLGQPPPNARVAAILAAAEKAAPADLTGGFAAIAADLVARGWAITPDRAAPPIAPAALSALVTPGVTVTARIKARVGELPTWLSPGWFDDGTLTPPMAAPVFTRPMYQALDDYSRDWLLPGLSTFQQTDIVTVLSSNAAFVEAFLAGLSHEMARALLWRGYPTDQRGTYFRRFWNGDQDELLQDLYAFSPTPLSNHVVSTLSGRVVLLIRGELVRRYPTAVVVAMLAGGTDANGHPIFEDPTANPGVKVLAPVLFHGHLEPDMLLVGFDLQVSEIQAAGKPGWWFVISEHPTAPRFGLREGSSSGQFRDPLGWGDLTSALGTGPASRGFLDPTVTKPVTDTSDPGSPQAVFGADAASTAHVLLRNPVRAAFAALSMLGPTGAVNV